ncbi:MAG: T9SS type A sorting domain-containing protein [Flavobacteriales bacterium]
MRHFFLLVLLSISIISFSQNDSCLNMGFNYGDFTNWNLYYGNTNASPFAIDSIVTTSEPSLHHKIFSGGLDPISGISRVFNGGSGFSAMIGDSTYMNRGAAILSRSFLVDTINYLYNYHYSLVMENPGHLFGESPFFTSRIITQSGDTIHNNQIASVPINSGADPDFITFGSGSTGGYYLPWRSQAVSLFDYIGQTVTIEFSSGDCAQGEHWAYAYVDVDCLAPIECLSLDFDFQNIQNITCTSQGLVETNITSGVPPYNYNWNSGESTSSIIPVTSGLYSLTVTDSLGCRKTKSVNISEPNYFSDFDLSVDLNVENLIEGDTSRIYLDTYNNGCVSTSGQLSLLLNSGITYVNSSILPDLISGDTLIWNIPSMNNDVWNFNLFLDVITNSNLSVFDTVCFDARISPLVGDIDSLNNFMSVCSVVFSGQYGSCSNLNFEYGDCTNWDIITGTVPTTPTQPFSFTSTGTSTCGVSLNHNIVTGGVDAIGGFPKVFPGGGGYSLQLGDETGTGNGAARIQQTFLVDSINSALAFYYALVLNEPGHTAIEQPYFTTRFFNQNGDTIYRNEIIASSSSLDPDFVAYSGGYYLPWKTQYVDLSSYAGQNVTVEFTTGDCAQGGHFGYAYVDAECLSPTDCMFFNLSLTDVNFIECDSAGHISTFVENGALPYTYQWSSGEATSEIFPTIPGIYDLTVTDSVGCVLTKSVLINGSNYAQFDLDVNLSANIFRVGQNTRIDLNAFNDGCVDTSGQLTLVLDDFVSYSNAYPVPDVINGDTLIWNTPSLNYDSTHFMPYVNVFTSIGAVIGDVVCFDVSIAPTMGDADTTNNQKQYCYTVLNSYDPNYKEVYPKGECFENYVLDNQELTYTVHFQNTGTAPAIDIFIMDTLNANLDINTVRIVGQSHDNLVTEVVNGNTLKFIFDNINLPDSTTDEAASHGSVVFTLQPITTIASPSRVENSVGIYFDFNEPIITNTVFNTFVDTIPHTETILTETAVTSYDLNGITYDSTGTYYQYLSSFDGCDSTIVLNLTITTTGIDVLNAGKNVVVYPNPIHNELKISASNTFVNYQVEVISITGQPMFKGNNTSKINTTSFAQGIYFVKVWNDKQIVIKKVIKE